MRNTVRVMGAARMSASRKIDLGLGDAPVAAALGRLDGAVLNAAQERRAGEIMDGMTRRDYDR